MAHDQQQGPSLNSKEYQGMQSMAQINASSGCRVMVEGNTQPSEEHFTQSETASDPFGPKM